MLVVCGDLEFWDQILVVFSLSPTDVVCCILGFGPTSEYSEKNCHIHKHSALWF